jgi:hypothetical protein
MFNPFSNLSVRYTPSVWNTGGERQVVRNNNQALSSGILSICFVYQSLYNRSFLFFQDYGFWKISELYFA